MTDGPVRQPFVVRFATALGAVGVAGLIAYVIGWEDNPWLAIGTLLVAAVLLAIGLGRSAPVRQVP